MKLTRRRFLALLAGGLAPLTLDLSFIEPYLFVETSHISITLPKPLTSTLRILHVTDTHFGNSLVSFVYEAVVSRAKEAKPDLIAYTGDLVSKAESFEDALSFVEALASEAPVFVVWGNWDHWSLGGEIGELKKHLEDIEGVKVLVNEGEAFRDDVYIVGVDDPYLWRSDLSQALSNAPDTCVKVLLAHSPQIIGEAAGKVDVVLAGHTHGGQVVIPLVGPLFVPLPSEYRRFLAGAFFEDGTYMYVSRGIGMSLLPVRFLCPPEVAVIDLEES